MNRRLELPQILITIDLAREPDFALGALQISPSQRQVISAGRQQTIQPRVMQVLVALAQAKGTVVSREELIERCWDGTTVGDDAINRCMAKVRQIADTADPRPFEIETIPRVGYRLKAAVRPESPAAASVAFATISPADATAPPPAPAARPIPWTWIAALTVVLAGAFGFAGAGWWERSTTPARWVVTGSEPPIASSLIERHPAISPDGTVIAYSAGPDVLSRQIYVRRISGGDPLRLTSDPWDDASPAWSPDGSQIAYVGYKEGEHCRLMLVPVLGGAPRELGRCGEDDRSHVGWSHAGDALYFLDDVKGNDRIVRLELATGRRRLLTHPPKSSLDEGEPAVSPDGRWMAFIRGDTGVGDHVIFLNMRTGAERQLFARNLGESGVWAEDSKSVFLENHYHDDFALTNYPLDGSRPVRILSSPEYLGRISVGPRGLLAVELNKLYDGLARAPAGRDDRPQFIESENGRAFTPNIRPDGTMVAAMKQPSGSGIWVIPRSGPMRKIFALDQDEIADAEPRWSPDGSRIAIASMGTHAIGMQVITPNGALVAAIPFRGRTFTPPVWTADGKSLIFPGFDTNGWRLWRVDVARPDSMRPLPQRGWLYIKSRGDELYGVREGKPGVWRIDGTPRQITRLPTLDHIDEWAIAGDNIAYVDDPFKPHPQIFAQPIRGGPPRVLARVPDYAWSDSFEIDPVTGAVIYVAKLSADSDIEILHLATQ